MGNITKERDEMRTLVFTCYVQTLQRDKPQLRFSLKPFGFRFGIWIFLVGAYFEYEG